MDLVGLLLMVGAFALLVTTHFALAFGLVFRRPRWRGPLALLVPPLAPYFGMLEKLRVRSWLWLAALALYVVGLIVTRVAR